MIKKLIIALLMALPVSVFAQKFGTVDAESIITGMPEYQEVQNNINKASKTYEDEFTKLTDEYNKKLTEFQSIQNDATTPESIKERRIQELQELDQKMQQFRNTAMQDLQRQQQQQMAPVEQKLMDAINAVGQEGQYTFIFPKGLAYYSGAVVEDVTPLVKAKLGIK